jgi:hypothetical protein
MAALRDIYGRVPQRAHRPSIRFLLSLKFDADSLIGQLARESLNR